MAIDLINIGNIANDGTGDDLREAFSKVNQNFEELDLRIPDEIIASNVGLDTAEGIFLRKVGPELKFKKIKSDESGRVIVSSDPDHVILDVIGGELSFETDDGTLILEDSISTNSVSIKGYVNPDDNTKSAQVVQLQGDDTIYIKANTRLKDDPNPKLQNHLDAQNTNIINANEVRAVNYFGDLRGTVYGIDVRTIEDLTSVFDFGFFSIKYSNPIQYLLGMNPLDFGSFNNPSNIPVDVGYL